MLEDQIEADLTNDFQWASAYGRLNKFLSNDWKAYADATPHPILLMRMGRVTGDFFESLGFQLSEHRSDTDQLSHLLQFRDNVRLIALKDSGSQASQLLLKACDDVRTRLSKGRLIVKVRLM